MEDEIAYKINSVKELIRSPKKYNLSEQEVLELTEDDIYDELDEDIQDPDEYNNIDKKDDVVNQILTSLGNNHSNARSYVDGYKEETAGEENLNYISKEIAARSAAHIRNIVKKMEKPADRDISFQSKYSLERQIFDSIKPLLEEWLEQNVANLIRKELESAGFKKDKIKY